jgi:cation transport ATPase
VDPLFKVVNDRIDSFSKVSSKLEKTNGVGGLILLSLYLLIVNMLLPSLPFTRGIYEYLHMFPESWGVCSLMVIINFIITLYVMIFWARHYIVRAFTNYVYYDVTNMETLIALGSISAFALFLFFMVRYSIEYYHGSHAMVSMAIMDIN